MNPAQLLLIEDDAAVADVVALHLRGAGYHVEHAADGLLAQRRLESQAWDLVLLDLTLPGIDGFELCRRLRQRESESEGPGRAGQGKHVPVIILSARTAEAERVLGLELGADDYMAKPFSMLELTARVRALLRRVEQLRIQLCALPAGQVLQRGSLRIEPASRKVRLGETELVLTLREFDLLHFLARHPGHIFSRGELLQRVWGDGFDGYEHTVNSHINRLRSKIEAAVSADASPRLIETVWGLGYRFHAPPVAPVAQVAQGALA